MERGDEWFNKYAGPVILFDKLMRLHSVLRCMLTRSSHPAVLQPFHSCKAKEAGRRDPTKSLMSFITVYINAFKKNPHTGSFATSVSMHCPARNHPSSLLQATQEPPRLSFPFIPFQCVKILPSGCARFVLGQVWTTSILLQPAQGVVCVPKWIPWCCSPEKSPYQVN